MYSVINIHTTNRKKDDIFYTLVEFHSILVKKTNDNILLFHFLVFVKVRKSEDHPLHHISSLF